MKVATVVGTRPEFIKIAPLLTEIGKRGYRHVLIHTGQHYDDEMSGAFFLELGLADPDYSLAGIADNAVRQVGFMLADMSPILVNERPDVVIVVGDTNSTLAGALAAAKLYIPVAHVEAGIRSFNRIMPEEINRIVVDHVSDFLFAPTDAAMGNLEREGLERRAFQTGDIIMDRFSDAVCAAEEQSDILNQFSLAPKTYNALTLHRPYSVDYPAVLDWVLGEVEALGVETIFPVHPRTRRKLLLVPTNVRIVEPMGYFDMVQLMRNAGVILTDSGGMQKEAYLLGVPCVTLRPETEWIETVDTGWNVLCWCESGEGSVLKAVAGFRTPVAAPSIFGSPGVSGRMLDILEGI